jgi:hypothetical protein
MADFEDPFRLRVLIALTDALRSITVANGYRHDLATSVFRGRDWFGADDPIPMLSILEQPLQPDQEVRGDRSVGDWELLLQGWVDDDPTHPTDPGHRLMGDAKRCLIKEKNRLGEAGRTPNVLGMGPGRGQGNEVRSLSFGGGVVRPPETFVSAKAHFWLTVTLGVAENLNNPYA